MSLLAHCPRNGCTQMKQLYCFALLLALSVSGTAYAQPYTVFAGWGPTMTTRNTTYVQPMAIEPSAPLPWGATALGISYQWDVNVCYWVPGSPGGAGLPGTPGQYVCPGPQGVNVPNPGVEVKLCWYDGSVLRDCVDVSGAKYGWIGGSWPGRYFGSFGGASNATNLRFHFKVPGSGGFKMLGAWNHAAIHY